MECDSPALQVSDWKAEFDEEVEGHKETVSGDRRRVNARDLNVRALGPQARKRKSSVGEL
jgi:hypothetical protein